MVVSKGYFKNENYIDLMHYACSYKSGYFPIYDDEYERVHYDDDEDHVSHDTRGPTDFQTSIQTTNSTMMGPRGCEPPEDPHLHIWVIWR